MQAVDKVTRELWDLGAELVIFRQLFVHDRADDLKLLNSISLFFWIVRQSLLQRMVLTLARLADRAKNKDSDNLSLEFLLRNLKSTYQPSETIANDLDNLLKSFRVEARRAIILRHKVYAHPDLKHAFDKPDQALGVSVKEISASYEKAGEFMNKLREAIDNLHIVFDLPGTALNGSDGEALLSALRLAEEHQSKCLGGANSA